jgi:tRNA(fMet)-specific endonuclease VapC
MKIAIDTNRYTDLCNVVPDAVRAIEEADRVYVPFIVLGELRAGFAHGTRANQNERTLSRFLMKPAVEVLFADDQTTHHYATLYSQLREQGTPIPTNDLWIAALVVQHNLVLHARDQHFDLLPQIARV